MERLPAKLTFALVAVAAAFLLLGRTAPADPIGIRVDNDANGLVVTVNTEAANVHFSYDEKCDGGAPCYTITAGQGMVGIPASSSGCVVKQGNGSTPTAIQCPANGVGSVQFKLVNGGTWGAYAGGGGQHAGTVCSPARVIITSGKGANSIDTWDGCHEVVNCNATPGAFTGVEVDASDDVHGTCTSVVKH
jgi:hypothetical protein